MSKSNQNQETFKAIEHRLNVASTFLNGFSLLMVEESKESNDDIPEVYLPLYACTPKPQVIVDIFSNEIGNSLNEIRTLVSELRERIS